MTKTKDLKPKTTGVVAILLAAGRSRRMGAFKPLLPFGETTVIRSCIGNLRAGGVESIVVVLGHRADEVQKSLRDLRLDFALNPDPESEMSASIACAVRELPQEAKAALIALSDQPAVPLEVIKVVLNEWSRGAKLVKPVFAGRGGHPVLVDLSFRAELLNLGPGGLRAFLALHRDQLRTMPVGSPFIARDMDTWDDYYALHQEIFGFAPKDQDPR
ncbi:MAG: nucleotidyltransferase family protein [Pyrinomonadaceae bacterium]